MKSSKASDNSGAIGLFPFLAVLLCTMGALLVLLVVLAEQAKRSAASEETPRDPGAVGATVKVGADSADEARALAKRLQQIRDRTAEFAALRRDADQRLQEEQARLSHLEEHARRLEHDLAQLYLAGQSLQAAEQHQVVDAEQAKRELDRLRRLAQDTRERIERQRQESRGKKSYAIVPYQGKHGTARRPIYIECTSDGVVIQPEGVVLSQQDFAGPRRPGNPLASAMRAAREHLNARSAAQDGQAALNPYPLLIVRPGGGDYYNAALRAIRDWDAEFGYEFVNEDASLQYSTMDPALGRSMQHAVEQARERQKVLAEIAPSRYGSLVGQFTPSPGDSSGMGGGSRVGSAQQPERYGRSGPGLGGGRGGESVSAIQAPAEDEMFTSAGVTAAGGAAHQPGGGEAFSGSLNREPYSAEAGGDLNSADARDADAAQSAQSSPGERGPGQGDPAEGVAGGRYAEGTNRQSGQSTDGGGQSLAATATGDSGSRVNPLETSGAGQTQGGVSGQIGDPGGADSGAASRGVDWDARTSNREAVAVRRPIRVAVYADRVALLASRHSSEFASPTGAVVMLNQRTERVVEELVRALREHMQQWGLAGRGLVWRPELIVEAAGGGEANAAKLARLLQENGIDVRPLESAAKPGENLSHGTR